MNRYGQGDHRHKQIDSPSVRRECGSTKCVTGGKLPHTGQELAETSIPKGHSENEVGSMDPSCLNVEHGEHEGGRAKAHQTERSRIGELSVKDGEGRLRVVDGVSTGSNEPERERASDNVKRESQ